MKRKFKGGLIGTIGFLLSPLSWWNDLFVNVPLALVWAWIVSVAWPAAFTASFVVAYWLTNVLGLVLLQRGAKELMTDGPNPYSRRELLKDAVISLLYTVVILALVKLGALKPFPEYVNQP